MCLYQVIIISIIFIFKQYNHSWALAQPKCQILIGISKMLILLFFFREKTKLEKKHLKQ